MEDKILNEILKEQYYNNYFENMKNKNETELIQILENTIKQNLFSLSKYKPALIRKRINEHEIYNMKLKIDNSKAIYILNYLIQQK